ncbi:NAD(P)H-binding protein [Streptomyces sp. NPDC006632]|uniref:SDR family oxidoreductase n=1 Tax=Streptomyces sp. NPDC006632 TaxID=3157182 RepID=UPI0033AB3F63
MNANTAETNNVNESDSSGTAALDIAVAGGTGTLGSHVVEELRARGHRVRVLSRGSDRYPVDLSTGAGLAEALAGCDVVVDAANSTSPRTMRATLVDGTRRLLDAERAAGVGHHVCVSIVGCDRVPMPYYKVKTDQEALVAAGRVPWTIVRATQFHELAASLFTATARVRFLPASTSVPVQPVAAAEAARAVADAAGAAPRNGRIEVAGPDRTDLRALAATWRTTTARRAVLLPVPIPGRLGRALRAGHLTDASPDVRGTIGFAQWLEARRRTE